MQNHQTDSKVFKCYLRTPDMKSVIREIDSSLSLDKLKNQVRKARQLEHLPLELIKLIVNQVELSDQKPLGQQLHQNCIIHVLTVSDRPQQQIIQQEFTLKFKQPPVNCPIYSLEGISTYLNVKSLKDKILSFYRIEHHDNQIAHLENSNLYLVYAGRVLSDDSVLRDYNVNGDGVLIVVNGNIYVREVTRQEAERRIQEVRRMNEANFDQKQEIESDNRRMSEQNQNMVFQIIQNIIHDQDSDNQEGKSPEDKGRSQRIIRRYDSLNEINDEEPSSHLRNVDRIHEQHEIMQGYQTDVHRNGRTAALQSYLSPEQQHTVNQYIRDISERVANLDVNDENKTGDEDLLS